MDDPRALRNIVSNTRRFLQSLGPATSPAARDRDTPKVSPLPTPQPIARQLKGAGLNAGLARKLSEMFLENAVGLRREFQRNMENTLQACYSAIALTDKDTRAVELAYTSRYQQALANYTDLVIATSLGQPSSSTAEKRIFDQV